VWSYAVSRAHSREGTRCKTAWLASRTFGKRQVASRPHSPPRGAVKAHHNGTLLKAAKLHHEKCFVEYFSRKMFIIRQNETTAVNFICRGQDNDVSDALVIFNTKRALL
jgi:hypothetical protein